MKLRSIFVAALAAMTFVSCSNDKTEEPGGGVTTPTGAETVMKLSLKRAQATKAHYGDLNVDAAKGEDLIKAVRVYIFNDMNVLEEWVDFAANEDEKTFIITTGPKTFHASVNMASAALFTPTKAMPLSEVKAKELANSDIAKVTDILADGTNAGFWMSTLADDQTETIEAATKDEVEGAAQKNNVEIEVGRAMAKVGVYYDPATASQTGGTLTSVKYKMHNNPVKTMVLPSFNTAGHRVTPFYSASYAAANYFNNTTYLSTELTGGKHTAPSYITENSNKVPAKGNSTFAMIEGVYTPTDNLVNADGTDYTGAALTPGADFWRIANYQDLGLPTEKFLNYETGIYVAQPAAGQVNPASQKALKYDGGKSYYGIWLKNDAISNADLKTVEKHTIARNSYWSVTITSVSGPGSNEEGGVVIDPEIPIDEDTYMQATMSVVDWDEVSHSGGI